MAQKTISPETWNVIRRANDARERWEAHDTHCRTCGFDLCAVGRKLHTSYTDLQNRINR